MLLLSCAIYLRETREKWRALTKLERHRLIKMVKRRDIKFMEELWNECYGRIGFSRQNLRDQAARLE